MLIWYGVQVIIYYCTPEIDKTVLVVVNKTDVCDGTHTEHNELDHLDKD